MTYVLGIDLGTTNSVVSCLEAGKPLVMPNSEGNKTTPSVVHYQGDDDPIVGDLAKRQRQLHPEQVVYSVKRFVGCRWDESESRREGLVYKVVEGPDGQVAVEVDGRRLMPEQVQADVLRKMRQTAEDYLGESIAQAVITCPAYFNDAQRSATKRAAEMAGLEALRIINEPTAAALAYGMDKGESLRVAVFDFGGGTFDVSILDIERDVFEVKATCGDTFLGGDLIDAVLVDWVTAKLRDEQGIDVSGDAQALGRIAEAAEKVKCELSSLDRTRFSLPFIGADETGPKHLDVEILRSEFEELIGPILERLIQPCRQAMRDAKLEPRDLDAVILVGGSTRIPAVQALAQEFFGRAPDKSVNPDEAVAIGAAIQAGIMSGDLDEILLLDVTPLSLGIELAGGLFSPLIARNSSIPTTARKKFTTVRDNQKQVKVHVMQGERREAARNRTLSRFVLDGISPAPREVPEIEVSFTIDANGILNVAAMDLTTGSVQQVRVESYQPVYDNAADRNVTEAHTRAEDDRQFLRKLAIRQRADEMRQDFESLRRQKDAREFTEDDERRIQEALFHLDITLHADDWGEVESAERELRSVHSEMMMLAGYRQKRADESAAGDMIGDMMGGGTQMDLDGAPVPDDSAPEPLSTPNPPPPDPDA